MSISSAAKIKCGMYFPLNDVKCSKSCALKKQYKMDCLVFTYSDRVT